MLFGFYCLPSIYSLKDPCADLFLQGLSLNFSLTCSFLRNAIAIHFCGQLFVKGDPEAMQAAIGGHLADVERTIVDDLV